MNIFETIIIGIAYTIFFGLVGYIGGTNLEIASVGAIIITYLFVMI
jgi:hypothetical protein